MISTKKKAPNFDVNIMMKIFLHKFDLNEDILPSWGLSWFYSQLIQPPTQTSLK